MLGGVLLALTDHLGDFLNGMPRRFETAMRLGHNAQYVHTRSLAELHRQWLNELYGWLGEEFNGSGKYATQQPAVRFTETSLVTLAIEELRKTVGAASKETVLGRIWNVEEWLDVVSAAAFNSSQHASNTIGTSLQQLKQMIRDAIGTKNDDLDEIDRCIDAL